MENRRSIIFVVAVLALACPAMAEDRLGVLDGPGIITAFEGHSVHGAYVEGLPFRETYQLGGAIEYWEPGVNTSGQWSVVNGLFCTFYEALNGGCFQVKRLSQNCFDYFTATTEIPNSTTLREEPVFTARGALSHMPSTCPRDLQS